VFTLSNSPQSFSLFQYLDKSQIFEKFFPSCRIFTLEKNYRSTQQILDAATAVVTHNDRRAKKREFRSLWIQRINAGVRAEGMTYSKFINGLNKSGVKLDRKVLADIAYNNPEVFKSIVKKVQSSLN